MEEIAARAKAQFESSQAETAAVPAEFDFNSVNWQELVEAIGPVAPTEPPQTLKGPPPDIKGNVPDAVLAMMPKSPPLPPRWKRRVPRRTPTEPDAPASSAQQGTVATAEIPAGQIPIDQPAIDRAIAEIERSLAKSVATASAARPVQPRSDAPRVVAPPVVASTAQPSVASTGALPRDAQQGLPPCAKWPRGESYVASPTPMAKPRLVPPPPKAVVKHAADEVDRAHEVHMQLMTGRPSVPLPMAASSSGVQRSAASEQSEQSEQPCTEQGRATEARRPRAGGKEGGRFGNRGGANAWWHDLRKAAQRSGPHAVRDFYKQHGKIRMQKPKPPAKANQS